MHDFPVPIVPLPDKDDRVSIKYHPDFSFADAHTVYEYSGIPIPQALQLDIYTFRTLLIDAVVANASQSDKGIQMVNTFVQVYGENNQFIDSNELKSNFGELA